MMNQKGRSDLPECRADATFLFDDVYKNSTRGEKKQADARQYGRSMVEMLGVLAIIGVLSVGGIAGYSKAMEKYKLNKFSEAMNTLLTYSIQNLKMFGETHSHTDGDSDTSAIYYTSIFEKLNMLPDGIHHLKTSIFFEDNFSNRLWIFAYPKRDIPSYGLGYMLSSEGLKDKLCYNLVNIAKEHAGELHSFMTDMNSSSTEYSKTIFRAYGDQYCNGDSLKCLRHLTMDEIHEACSQCEKDRGCRFYFTWR